MKKNIGIIESLLKLFMFTDTNFYSDKQTRKILFKTTQNKVNYYKKGRKNIKSHFDKEKSLDRLIVLRSFADELWNLIISKKPMGRVVYVIDEALLRVEIATDENIALIGHGYGVGAVGNLRQMLESLAIAKYIWTKGESEAERFQDHAEYQDKKIIEKYKDDPSFQKDQGWISDKKDNTLKKLIWLLKNNEYKNMYDYCCNLIHASSYSMEKVMQLNHERRGCDYFPLEFEETIRFNEKIIVDFLVFLIDCYMDKTVQRGYKILLKTIVDNMEGCPGDELLKLD